MSPTKKSAGNKLSKGRPPFETEKLREAIKAFMESLFPGTIRNVGSFRWGIYAFYDYDGEPIYVGQTYEGLSSRIGRHLTNQRTDAVAMSVLDPFEVFEIEVFPLPDFDELRKSHPEFSTAKAELNRLELEVFNACIEASEFKRILNEQDPAAVPTTGKLPRSYRARIVSDEVAKIRSHPDTRIARRAQTIARLAQTISERQVKMGLRRTLLAQALRLNGLAEKRFMDLGGDASVERKRPQENEAQSDLDEA